MIWWRPWNDLIAKFINLIYESRHSFGRLLKLGPRTRWLVLRAWRLRRRTLLFLLLLFLLFLFLLAFTAASTVRGHHLHLHFDRLGGSNLFGLLLFKLSQLLPNVHLRWVLVAAPWDVMRSLASFNRNVQGVRHYHTCSWLVSIKIFGLSTLLGSVSRTMSAWILRGLVEDIFGVFTFLGLLPILSDRIEEFLFLRLFRKWVRITGTILILITIDPLQWFFLIHFFESHIILFDEFLNWLIKEA